MFILFTVFQEELSKNKKAEKLILQIAEGKEGSMDELYALIKTDVFAYAISKTCNKFVAEDVVQDTFVSIYKYAKQYVPCGKPMAWVITIAKNHFIKFCRSQQRIMPLESAETETTEHHTFEEKMIDSQFLREMFAILTDEEREIISLHVVSGFKHKEIAKLMECPLSTVLSKYNRAIKKLQKAIKEETE